MGVEEDARLFAERILKLAEETDVDSSVFVLAMADVIGVVAATLDGQNMHSLDERIESLNKRIRERYYRMMAARPIVISDNQRFIRWHNPSN